MSIMAMANAAIARRADFPPLNEVPKDLTQISRAAGGSAAPTNQVTSALNVIVTYIPTEILTLYVAVLAALGPPAGSDHTGVTRGMVLAFWAFLVATPATIWVIYAVKLKSGQKQIPLRPTQWPVWEIAAGTIAYAAWAFALPNNPFVRAKWYSSALAGVIVLVTSTVLGLLAPLFQRQLSGDPG